MTPGFKQLLRRHTLWALLAPFFLLSLVAPGVMPVQRDGILKLVICTSDGPVELMVDGRTGEPVKTAPDGGSDRCHWAAAHPSVLLATQPDAPTLLGQGFPVELPLAETVLAVARRTGLPPATGPPTVV